MLQVGLTGGIASGKSTVARFLRQMGAPVIDADQLARAVVAPGAEAYAAVVKAFGAGILLPDGVINRRRLGELVFADASRRKRLEAIVHPAVQVRRDAELQALEHQGLPVVVLDIPLLIETGLHSTVDRVWLVYVDPETQLHRLMLRDHLDEEAARQRLAAQMPIDDKRRYAHAVIDNRGSLDETYQQVTALWDAVIREATREI